MQSIVVDANCKRRRRLASWEFAIFQLLIGITALTRTRPLSTRNRCNSSAQWNSVVSSVNVIGLFWKCSRPAVSLDPSLRIYSYVDINCDRSVKVHMNMGGSSKGNRSKVSSQWRKISNVCSSLGIWSVHWSEVWLGSCPTRKYLPLMFKLIGFYSMTYMRPIHMPFSNQVSPLLTYPILSW